MTEAPLEGPLAPKVSSRHWDFWVEAMLPAFFVVDANLDVVNHNRLSLDLLDAAGLVTDDLLDAVRLPPGRYTFRLPSDLAATPPGSGQQPISISEHLVHPDHHPQMREFVRLFNEQRQIIEDFNRDNVARLPDDLADLLRGVHVGTADVRLYAYAPRWTPSVAPETVAFRGGVRIAPTAGIRLNIRAQKGSADSRPLPNIVDIVCAWRILCHWHEDQRRIARLTFYGAQPAFHDATARHRLWQAGQQQVRAEAEANLTRLWSHALGTDVRTLNSARDCVRDLYTQPELDQPRQTALAYLWLEKAYAELSSHVGFLRIVRSLSASRLARAEELRSATTCASLSSLIVSSVASALRTLLADREFAPWIHPSHTAAIDEHRGEWLEAMLRLSREPNRSEQLQLRELVTAVGITVESWELDDSECIMAPTRSPERDDEAVTSRALHLLFEEYAYNALKAILKQERPRLWLRVRLADAGRIVVFHLENSCHTDHRGHGTWDREDEEGTRDNQKGLFTNYRVFSELFDSPLTGYRRRVSADRFAIELTFPADAFIVNQQEHD